MATKEIKVELLNEKQETVVYKTNFVSGRKVREALEVSEAAESDEYTEVEKFDKMLDFVASVFPKLTGDMILDGTASWDVLPLLQDVLGQVIGADPKQAANV
ncbi:MAG: hypothetical protein L0K82_03500 [Pisciglobus halotolerans]|nr:hypothetical protein [Pisciglobus halotolerans]